MISALYKFRKIKRRRFYDTGNIIDLQKETNYIHVALQLHIAFSFFFFNLKVRSFKLFATFIMLF